MQELWDPSLWIIILKVLIFGSTVLAVVFLVSAWKGVQSFDTATKDSAAFVVIFACVFAHFCLCACAGVRAFRMPRAVNLVAGL